MYEEKNWFKTGYSVANKLGHGISYDDVNCLETSLAESQMCDKVLKTFVPSNIQPSQFVTFVWDNNDINPESLSGVSMHCTNGIIIQLPTSSSDLYQASLLFVGVNQRVELGRDHFKLFITTLNHII